MESKAVPERSKDPDLSMPEELINQILLRLPVKSLLRFRCVSKSWLSLISSPQFVKSHLCLSASNKDYTHGVICKAYSGNYDFRECSVSSLLYDSVTETIELDYPGKDYCDDYSGIVGSVNGLVCIFIRVGLRLYDLFIWNPSIRKYKKLPSYSRTLSSDAEDEDGDPFSFNFAYDELQNDYKVVGIFPISSSEREHLFHTEVKIYSLKNDLWKCVDDYQGKEFWGASAKFLNGKLHWPVSECSIISIDLTDERWAKLERPCYYERCNRSELEVFEGDLSVFYYYERTHADVWVMKEYGVKESWTKMFTIKFPEYSYYVRLAPILMSNEGEILFQFGSCFMKYNPKDDSIRYLNVTNLASAFEVQIYVKSLVCPF